MAETAIQSAMTGLASPSSSSPPSPSPSPSVSASAVPVVAAARRERSLKLTSAARHRGIQLVRIESPSLTRAQFHALWQSATSAVRASCSFTRYHRRLGATNDSFIGHRRPRRRSCAESDQSTPMTGSSMSGGGGGGGVGDDNLDEVDAAFLAVAAAMEEDEHLDFEAQLLHSLGEEIVVFSRDEEDEAHDAARRSLAQSELVGEREFVVYAYASVVIAAPSASASASTARASRAASTATTVLLIRMEQLHGSEQIAIAVKNTDPVEDAVMQAFMAELQHRIQPGAPPHRPQAGPRRDTVSVFLTDEDGIDRERKEEGIIERGKPVDTTTDTTLPPPSPMATSVTETGSGRGRSNTVRYRSGKGVAFEGYVNKKSDLLNSWRVVYGVLEGDTLAYYESREDFIANINLVGRIQVQGVAADADGSSPTKDPNVNREATPRSFVHRFRVFTEGYQVHLSSRTAFEKEQWQVAIRRVIAAAKREAETDCAPGIGEQEVPALPSQRTSTKGMAAKSTPSRSTKQPAFASQALDPTKFYRLLGALLRQEVTDFPMLFRYVHPDVILTSNFPPIVPFWGQYRRYDGILLFISTMLESVGIEMFEVMEVIELVRGDADCIDGLGDPVTPPMNTGMGNGVDEREGAMGSTANESPRQFGINGAHPTSNGGSSTPMIAAWEKRLVITGKETYNLLDFGNRRITQLFVHELWLDQKGRLVRWHMNGDAVALSVAFDSATKGNNVRLVLPGEASSITHSIPEGMFYVQIMRAQQLVPLDVSTNGTSSSNPSPSNERTQNGSGHDRNGAHKKPYSVYARCNLEEGTHMERTMDGVQVRGREGRRNSSPAGKTRISGADSTSSTQGTVTERRRPSTSTRLFRGLKRAAGLSGERTFAGFGDHSGCVTSICKCHLEPLATISDAQVEATSLHPEWRTNLRLEFPGCARGFSYFLKLEVFQSRFMLPDELLGVCKINLTPHLSLFNGSAEAKANGALPRWHNLCDQYNDCRESWAPPTVFRGRIQVAVIFAPTIRTADALSDPKIQGRRLSRGSRGKRNSRRASIGEETLVESMSMSNEGLRKLLRGCGDGDQQSRRRVAGRVVVGSSSSSSKKSTQVDQEASHGGDDTESSLADGEDALEASSSSSSSTPHQLIGAHDRANHSFYAKRTKFDVPLKYQLIKVVGSGTYGDVIAASDTESGTTVAIKKITQAFRDLPDTKRILRELCLLRQLQHPNLIRLHDLLRPPRLNCLEDIYLVTDLMETDLHRVVHSAQTLTDEHVAYFMRQIFRALRYLHSANILHRDLKPSNVLVTSTCDLKVCDLGLARYIDYSQAKAPERGGSQGQEAEAFVQLTEYVVTRWYRAPEILLDGCRYDKPSDMWSAGCILAELLGRKPLFPGTSTTNQLHKILSVLGTPDIVYIAHVRKDAAQRWLHRQRRRPRIPFAEIYPSANVQALDLLEKLLVYDPKKRLTAADALRHPYLRQAFQSAGEEMGNGTRDLASPDINADALYYTPEEEIEDTFVGKIDDGHERVAETKVAMQEAVFDQICQFHPEARDHEALLREHDQQFVVDPATGKLVPVAV